MDKMTVLSEGLFDKLYQMIHAGKKKDVVKIVNDDPVIKKSIEDYDKLVQDMNKKLDEFCKHNDCGAFK